jgi:hypothetical protein
MAKLVELPLRYGSFTLYITITALDSEMPGDCILKDVVFAREQVPTEDEQLVFTKVVN